MTALVGYSSSSSSTYNGEEVRRQFDALPAEQKKILLFITDPTGPFVKLARASEVSVTSPLLEGAEKNERVMRSLSGLPPRRGPVTIVRNFSIKDIMALKGDPHKAEAERIQREVSQQRLLDIATGRVRAAERTQESSAIKQFLDRVAETRLLG